MKKLYYFYLLVLCLLAVGGFTSCGKDNDDSSIHGEPTNVAASFSKSSLTIGPEETTELLTFTVGGGDEILWIVDSEADWCRINEAGFASGTYSTMVHCFENTSEEDRSATIKLIVEDEMERAEAYCTITQKGK